MSPKDDENNKGATATREQFQDEEININLDNTDNEATSVMNALMMDNSSLHANDRRFSMAESDRHFSASYDSERSEDGGEIARIVKKENKWINPSRIAVYVILLLCGITLGIVAYFLGRKAEETAAISQFDNMAAQMITMSQNRIQRAYDVLESLSITMTSSTTSGSAASASSSKAPNNKDNEVYPPGFITLPNVEQQFGTARMTMEASQISYMPYVSSEQDRNEWQIYSVMNNYWIIEANAAHKLMNRGGGSGGRSRNLGNSRNNEFVDSPPVGLDPIADQIWEYSSAIKIPVAAPLGSGPYSPVWLLSPPPPIDDTFIINYNLQNYSLFNAAITTIEETNRPFFGVDNNNPLTPPPQPQKEEESYSVSLVEKSNSNDNDNNNPQQPTALIVYPVFQDFLSSPSSRMITIFPPSVIVGHLAASISLEVFLQDIFLGPQDDEYPLWVVLENTCSNNNDDDVITYKVTGNQTQLWNDSEDDHVDNNLLGGSQHSSVLVEQEQCMYTIKVFPTKELVDEFQTQRPIICLVVILGTFVFAMLLFLLYDALVTKRENKIILSAQKTQALVSTLFPKTVQERILNQGDTAQRGKGDPGDDDDDSYDEDDAEPIADFFPQTTIMFADIAGFTAWSSIREPAQVFTLLETLYHDFDMIARRRRVFKVETIGDCYVAVCGCPNPIDDHHVVMGRFASDCLNTLQSITKKLEISLGVGTADLALRVGLHSGAVTAGVLRGERARFQLFGDTMNTASRMESTGIKNKIQVSQETADLLIASGKSKWLTEREGGVEAKGKGTLRTYLLYIAPKHRNSTTTSVTETFSPDSSVAEILTTDSSGVELVSNDSNCDSVDFAGAEASPSESADPRTSASSGPGTSASADPRTSASTGSTIPPGSPGTSMTSASPDPPTSAAAPPSRPSPPAKSGPSPRELEAIRNATKKRFVQFNTELLKKILLLCVSQRKADKSSPIEEMKELEEATLVGGSMVIDEFQDAIGLSEATPNPANGPTKPKRRKKKRVTLDIYDNPAAMMNLPQHNRGTLRRVSQKADAKLSEEAEEQLKKYISAIADAYPSYMFHNFEHASHVAMSVNKLMNRAAALNQETPTGGSRSPESILADPLVEFTVILSALIHDVDYPGVPNSQLIKEGSELATTYQNRSIAEQHSVDVAWKMLMSDSYEDLRRAIYTNKTEFTLFRSLIVNAVISTDIFDPKLSDNSKARWDKAFSEGAPPPQDGTTATNLDRKTTLIIECILQASDLAHTMQHWSIYRKWDARLFEEIYKAYQAGRSDNNPATAWYQGQLAFFDFYVIPLAKKLKESAVFGVSSDEYLSCAKKNREEWQRRGTEIVAEMVAKVEGGA